MAFAATSLINQSMRRTSYHKYSKKVRQPDLTLVIASRSLDGVILIADKRIMREDEQRHVYGDKLIEVMKGVIVGYAGSRPAFDLFRIQLKLAVSSNPKAVQGRNREEKLVSIIAETLRKVHDANLELVVAIANSKRKASAWHFYSTGVEEITNVEMIGSGYAYAYLLLRSSWWGFRIMSDVADIGYFLIKYIEELKITNEVGLGNQYPLIWFIPDKGKAYKATPEMLAGIHKEYLIKKMAFQKALAEVFKITMPTDPILKEKFQSHIKEKGKTIVASPEIPVIPGEIKSN